MNNTLPIVLIILLIGYISYDVFFSEKITTKAIESIIEQHSTSETDYQRQDSLYSAMLDSMSIMTSTLLKDVYDLRVQNFKTREANENTYKKLDSLSNTVGIRPNF